MALRDRLLQIIGQVPAPPESAAAAGLALRDRPDERPRDAASTLGRRLTWSYLTGLALIAAALFVSASMILGLLREQSASAIAAQRAQEQRVWAAELLSAAGAADRKELSPEEVSQALAPARAALAAGHAALTQGPQAPAHRDAGLIELYFTGPDPLDPRMREALRADPPEPLLTELLPALAEAARRHAAQAAADAARTRDGFGIWLLAALALLTLEAVIIFRPIVRRSAALADRLDREAHCDSLTGLMNRRAVAEWLQQGIGSGAPLAVISLDLDGFKDVNDSEGHEAGDALLREVAERIRGLVRRNDLVARLGGDEFLVLFPGLADECVAMAIAGRLREALHRPVAWNGRALRLGATLGVGFAPGDADSPELLLRAADEALIRAKRSARGSIGRACREDATRALREAAVLRALGDAPTGAVAGLGAELRPVLDFGGAPLALEARPVWNHPQLGTVSEAELIAVAGRSGLAASAARQVRRSALAERAAAGGEGLRLMLPLAGAELLRAGIAEDIAADARASAVPMARLDLLVCEAALRGRSATTAIARLGELRRAGARLVLDDFGSGMADLDLLLHEQPDAVRLSTSLTRPLGHEARAERILGAVVTLVQSLGVEVLAKGIETEAQAQLLARLGCDGYAPAPVLVSAPA
jgi:diguanylate cyclase (GGDEF)-like protein